MNSLLLAVILGLVLQPSAPVQTSEVVITGPSGEQRITATDLAALPRVTLTIDDHDTKATFEGVELRHLLEKVGPRIVAEGDKRMGRSARQVVRIALGAVERR